MSQNLPVLPSGFVLEPGPASPAVQTPPLPAGFVLEGVPEPAVAPATKSASDPYLADLPIPGSPTQPSQPASSRNAALDLTGQAATGGVEGLGSVADLPALLERGLRSIGPAVSNKVLGTDFAMPDSTVIPPLGTNLVNAMDNAGVLADDPDGLIETIFRRTGQELGAAAVPVAGEAAVAARPLTAAARGVGVSVATGAGAGVAQSVAGPDNVFADLIGQVGGATLAGGLSKLPRLITPNPVTDPELIKAVGTLDGEGVHLTAGQRTGNKGLQYAESMIGGDSAEAITDLQAQQFTRAALQRAGIQADRASPEVMDAAFNRIGQDFDALVAQSTMPLDQQLATDLFQTLDDYDNFVPGGMQAPVIRHVVEGLSGHLNTSGMLDGPTYQAYRSQIDRAARGAAANPYLQDALYGIRNAMDGAVERGLQQTNPDAVAQWRQARSEYRNLLVIEKAASHGGENAALGIITPQNLRNAVQQQGTRAYVRGQGDYANLARAGSIAMPQLPNSGTAQRLLAILKPVGSAGVGAATALNGGDLATAAASTAGAFLSPRIAEAALMNPGTQAYLSNQALTAGARAARPPSNFQDWLEQFVANMPTGPVAGAYAQGQIESGGDVAEDPYIAAIMRDFHPKPATPAGGMSDQGGLVEAGNIDLHARPIVRNDDGTISTVRSMSFEEDGQEVLIPTVSDDGRLLSDDEAIDLYRRTGKHLGKFDSPEAATVYAEKLHNDQAAEYGDPVLDAIYR